MSLSSPAEDGPAAEFAPSATGGLAHAFPGDLAHDLPGDLPAAVLRSETVDSGPDEEPETPGRWRAGTLTYTRAGLATLFGWLLWGDFTWQMRDRAVVPVVQLLLKHLHASDTFNGLLIGSLPSAFGLLLGPLINTWSDRTRSRWGRRIPFLLAPTPFAALALVGLAFTPALGRLLSGLSAGTHSPAAWSRDCFAVFWTVFELAAVTNAGIFYALVNDVVPRRLTGRAFGVFRAVSLLAGILFNYWIIGHAEAHFTLLFVCLALIYAAGMVMMCARVNEGQYPPPERTEGPRRNPLAPVADYLRHTFSRPYYVWIYVATTLALLAPVPVNAFSVFYAKSIGLPIAQYGKYLALTYAISFCLAYGLGWLCDRFHPLRISSISIGLYGAAMLWGGLCARTPGTFAVAFVAHGVLSGCLFTTIVPTFQRLFPQARFGEFYSAANVLGGLAAMVVPPLVGLLLDHTGHLYRETFLEAGVIGLIAFAGLLIVQRQFQSLGGPARYVAPE